MSRSPWNNDTQSHSITKVPPTLYSGINFPLCFYSAFTFPSSPWVCYQIERAQLEKEDGLILVSISWLGIFFPGNTEANGRLLVGMVPARPSVFQAECGSYLIAGGQMECEGLALPWCLGLGETTTCRSPFANLRKGIRLLKQSPNWPPWFYSGLHLV